MSQHDYNIANQTGLEFRVDLNNALQAIVTDNSGATAPSTTFPGMVWRDTSSSPSVLKKRTDADDGWVTVLTAAGEAITGAASASDQRTALGLGTAATLNVGTAANNIVQLDGAAKLPAVDGSNLTGVVPTYPTQTGNSGKFLTTNGSYVAWDFPQKLSSAIATTSSNFKDFSISPTTRRIIISLDKFSTSGTSVPIIVLGTSSGIENSGYAGACSNITNGVSTTSNSVGFNLASIWPAGSSLSGTIELVLLNPSTNTWACRVNTGLTDRAGTTNGGGTKTLSGTLTTVRLFTTNGTDLFDSGTAGMLQE